MKRIAFTLLTVLAVAGAGAAQTPANPFPNPPPVAAPRPVAVPTPTDTRLPNGLRVIVAGRPGSGLVSMRLLLPKAGTASAFTDAAPGTAQAVAELLTKGTTTRTAPQIAEEAEQIGAQLGAGAGYDSASVSLSVLKSRLAEALPLFADVVRNPTFPAAEVERYRAQTADGLAVAYRSPGTLARLVAARVLFGDAPYGVPLGGTPETVAKLSQAELARFYGENYSPSGAILIISGDLSASEAQKIVTDYFGDWKADAGEKPTKFTPLPPPERRQIVVIDRPDAGQAAVLVNRFGTSQKEANPEIAELANDILGGGYSSRLNREVRVKRGLSYGANSGLAVRAERGSLTLAAQTKNESAGETARVLTDELARLAKDAPAPDEFAARKSALGGDFARSLETGAGLASLIGDLALYNRPLSELGTYLARVQAVTPKQVTTFAKERFGAAGANVVIVGNAKAFVADLRKRFPGETLTVIPFADLDLNTPGLRKGGG